MDSPHPPQDALPELGPPGPPAATATGEPPSSAQAPPERAASPLGLFALRLCLVYFALFAFPYPLTFVPDVRALPQVWHHGDESTSEVNWNAPEWIDDLYTWRGRRSRDFGQLEQDVVDWSARNVLGHEEVLQRPRYSGDPLFGYIRVAARAALAVLAAVLWSLLAWAIGRRTTRGQGFTRALGPWLHLAARYYLATVLLGYGLSKVFPRQFVSPSFARLETPFGDGSPMNLLWNFMGASTPYVVFSGVVEVLPALLLFFRRTALLGALLAAGVMVNVVMLNMCYDVPVKILSTHLLVIAAAVTAPHLRQLFQVLVLQRPAPPGDLARPRTGLAGHVIRLTLLIPTLALATDRAFERYRSTQPPSPLHGMWDVEEFLVDGADRVPRTDDHLRFASLLVDSGSYVHLKTMDGSLRSVDLDYKESRERLTLRTRSLWNYELDGDTLLLEGEHQWSTDVRPGELFSGSERRAQQLRILLRRDDTFAQEPPKKRGLERIPEALRGRWQVEEVSFIGDLHTRKRRAPFGWTAMELDVRGDAVLTFPLSLQEYAVRVKPDKAEEEDAPVGTPTTGTLTFRSSSKFDVTFQEDGRLHLDGELKGQACEIGLRPRDPASHLLVRRGFHWTNEIPLNRF